MIEVSEVYRLISAHLDISVDEWRQEIMAGEARNQPVIDLIRSLRKRYKTALLSNVGRGSLSTRFSDEELADWFEVVVASGEVGMAKPDPEIYQHTAEKLDVKPSECLFIDDRPHLLEGAKKVGMKTILYQDFEQMKGELEKILATDTEG